MVLTYTLLLVAATRSAVTWLGVRFYTFSLLEIHMDLLWDVMFLPWPMASFHIAFPSLAAFFKWKISLFDTPITVATVVTLVSSCLIAHSMIKSTQMMSWRHFVINYCCTTQSSKEITSTPIALLSSIT